MKNRVRLLSLLLVFATALVSCSNRPSSSGPAPPKAAATSLQLVRVTSPVAPGGHASITVKASPGALASITVVYKSGLSQAQGLVPKTSGADGTVTWTWKVGTRTTPGVWSIVVKSGGQTLRVPFEVR